MAERVIVVCDVCSKSPAETIGITAKDSSYRKDLCSDHLADLLKGARAPRRGRPAGGGLRSRTATAAKTAKPAKPAVAPAAEPVTKRERKKITDPVILEKRRAALTKARQARADKRAAAKSAG